jgi:uncharacterized repeat protein (TIGR03803 family)
MTGEKIFGPTGRSLAICMVIAAVVMVAARPVKAQTESVLLTFEATSSGSGPLGGLTVDSANNLYGTTTWGGIAGRGGPCDNGNSGCGTVFELSPPKTGNAWTSTVLYRFTNSPDGSFPTGPLVFDKAGNLYGTTQYGGGSGGYNTFGTIFELSPPSSGSGTWTETILYRFQSSPDAEYPNGGLVIDSKGNLYGTTIGGGSCGDGTVFQLSPPASSGGAWTEQVIYSFKDNCKGQTNNDGSAPFAGLAMYTDGSLYGTTLHGGSSASGTVFKLTPPAVGKSNWTEKILYSFTGGNDGGNPWAPVTINHGNVYGTAAYGATSVCNYYFAGCGTVFELSRGQGSTWTETTIFSFDSSNGGANPRAGVVFDKKGNLYTAAGDGGNLSCQFADGQGCGAVIKLAPPTTIGNPWTETTLYSFNGRADGAAFASTLIFGLNNRLYGTTFAGGDATCTDYGSLGCGVVFRIIP